MRTSSLTASRPVATDLGILAPKPIPTDFPAHGAPIASGVVLTPKGERYAAEQANGRRAPTPRLKIERAIDRHLSLVTVLLALLDDADGDPDLEPSLGAPEPVLLQAADYFTQQRVMSPCVIPDAMSSQERWARGDSDDDETVNEDGGDINDQPQDDYDQDLEIDEPTVFNPKGAHLAGGGSGI